MPKNPNQKLKILYLMKILLENTDEQHSMSLSEITEKLASFGIKAERKSLYDDFEALRVYGIDIVAKRNPITKYYVSGRDFELAELKLLVDAVQSSKFITPKKSEELIRKIESLVSLYDAQKLQRQVFVSGRIKTMNESVYYAIDAIHEAISADSKVRFKYFDWNEKKQKIVRHNGADYNVSPWALTWDNENYYLIAFDDMAGIIKHYRVDKMIYISVLDEKRGGREAFESFDTAAYMRKMFGMYGGDDEIVTLRCRNKMAGIMIDRFGSDAAFREDDPEHFMLTVKIAMSDHFVTWLMNFGHDVKIISPKSAIDRLISVANTALEVNQNCY